MRFNPAKRMLSSMSPTILLKDGEVVMVLGTPGGSTIFTSVFQTVVNILDYNMSPYEAVAATPFSPPAIAAGPDHLQRHTPARAGNNFRAWRPRLSRRATPLGIR